MSEKKAKKKKSNQVCRARGNVFKQTEIQRFVITKMTLKREKAAHKFEKLEAIYRISIIKVNDFACYLIDKSKSDTKRPESHRLPPSAYINTLYSSR